MASVPANKISALPTLKPISSPAPAKPPQSDSEPSFQEHLRRANNQSVAYDDPPQAAQAPPSGETSPAEGNSEAARPSDDSQEHTATQGDESANESDVPVVVEDVDQQTPAKADSDIENLADEVVLAIDDVVDHIVEDVAATSDSSTPIPDVIPVGQDKEVETKPALRRFDGDDGRIPETTEPRVRPLTPASDSTGQSNGEPDVVAHSPSLEVATDDESAPESEPRRQPTPQRHDAPTSDTARSSSTESQSEDSPLNADQVVSPDAGGQLSSSPRRVTDNDRPIRREMNEPAGSSTLSKLNDTVIQTAPESPTNETTAPREAPVDGTSNSATAPVAGEGEGSLQSRLPQHVFARGGDRGSPAGPISDTDQARFVQRVAKAFEAAQTRDGEIRLRLSPPELGSLRLEVKVQGGAMTVRIEADTATARSMLLDNMPVLRERLAEQGVRVEQFDVDLTDRRGGGLFEGQEQTDDHNGRTAPRNDADPGDDAQTSPSSDAGNLPQQPNDGRLNVII